METEIEITREEGDSKGRYVAVVDGHVAEMTYSRLGASTIIIDHTGVPDALRGRGYSNRRHGSAASRTAEASWRDKRIVTWPVSGHL
ncbi:GNAT family N-acetyltransferase [Pseudoponticoccus marisrubri]|uniref:N-acetyltransferase domain-containing protein n=1 Tax=Pseudoponticoccus marisrubri TaxID=1685382 RepID=A0A0W7WJN1_9RHOB|nr:N-acetyltransferase [Pseudoponticoccus marisrubri]KUF10726.1 hypothetical protein AVJ23_09785 [Pseudoponticoccus marisrubri]